MNLQQTVKEMAVRAKKASYALAQLNAKKKQSILFAMAKSLLERQSVILEANQKDMDVALKAGMSAALLDRLRLTPDRIANMADSISQIAELKDSLNEFISRREIREDLIVNKIRVPIGVITVIYESRPNVTSDVAALCLKTGNAVILRGGSDALHSNQAIVNALLQGGSAVGLPNHALQLLSHTDYEAMSVLLKQKENIDLVIPRGGEALIEFVMKQSEIPVIKHDKGLCHIYIAEDAEIQMVLSICENAKCQRPGVCNAVETVLIHEAIAHECLPLLVKRLRQCGVEIRGDEISCAIVPDLILATEEDWSTEYLDLILSIKIVPDIAAAIDHINHYGSHHSDAIISNSTKNQQQFVSEVDSAVVYINASTRFTDGGQFGMGAEIGISTGKLHARGPMGLEELTTYKYVVEGCGQVR